jgi:nicotinate-nucleotide adenylyltransferase
MSTGTAATGDGAGTPEAGQMASTPRPAATGRLGIMGGTFDPIHIGHLAIAEAARETLGLDRVLFLPAGAPPHKPGSVTASAADRVAMVTLAIAGNPAFELSRVDVDRAGPSYTADSIRLIAAGERAADREPELILVVSAETFAELPDWHEPERLLAQAGVAVVPRDGHPAPDPAWIKRHFPDQVERILVLDGPRLGISSTAIRERVRTARSIRYLVPEAVERYIVDHGLYRSPSPPRNSSS